MVRKKQVSSNRKVKRDPSGGAAAEDRRGVVLTVAWMLTTMATLAALLTFGLTRWLVALVEDPQTLPVQARVFPGLMLATAAISGLVSLLLCGLAHRWSRQRPPRLITWAALLIAAAPWLTYGLLLATGGGD